MKEVKPLVREAGVNWKQHKDLIIETIRNIMLQLNVSSPRKEKAAQGSVDEGGQGEDEDEEDSLNDSRTPQWNALPLAVKARVMDVVWAKSPGSPWWPGVIYHPANVGSGRTKIVKDYLKVCGAKYLVLFYGSEANPWNYLPYAMCQPFDPADLGDKAKPKLKGKALSGAMQRKFDEAVSEATKDAGLADRWERAAWIHETPQAKKQAARQAEKEAQRQAREEEDGEEDEEGPPKKPPKKAPKKAAAKLKPKPKSKPKAEAKPAKKKAQGRENGADDDDDYGVEIAMPVKIEDATRATRKAESGSEGGASAEGRSEDSEKDDEEDEVSEEEEEGVEAQEEAEEGVEESEEESEEEEEYAPAKKKPKKAPAGESTHSKKRPRDEGGKADTKKKGNKAIAVKEPQPPKGLEALHTDLASAVGAPANADLPSDLSFSASSAGSSGLDLSDTSKASKALKGLYKLEVGCLVETVQRAKQVGLLKLLKLLKKRHPDPKLKQQAEALLAKWQTAVTAAASAAPASAAPTSA
eukprot:CAMPEP_0172612116 /NCGR_PEP_ID=MMETSP1068-20121228/31725_1 /TAXON_ID=35684 /ORGANISM="Pseudopedinella elastica, Strain CCMP716" /LENGTH=524 /DNA_ID=CAMNT_0013416261 /DNA_START=78 /DNA_END=1648 /DNA_ORIENTATION=+